MLREVEPAEVGRRLRKLRRSVDWTQRRLAAELGQPSNHNIVARVERGEAEDVGFNRLVGFSEVLARPLGRDPDEVWDYLVGRANSIQMSYSSGIAA